MAVIRWDPWGELAALQRDVNELFGRGATQPTARVRGQGLVPLMDAYQTKEGLVVRVELPGMAPENVDVSVQDGVLTISGERGVDVDVPDDAWVRRERPVGHFQRSFSLPEGVEAEQIEARFDHGLLELRVPHPPERKPHRVQVASGSEREAIDVGD